MATIAGMAVKISANITDMTKGIQEVISNIDNIASVAEKASPS